MSKLGELKKAISLINDRIDSICTKKCDELGLDKDKVLGKSKKTAEKTENDDTLGESASSDANPLVAKVPNVNHTDKTGASEVESSVDDDSDNDDTFDVEDILSDREKLRSTVDKLGGSVGIEQQQQQPRIEVNDGDGKEDYAEHLLKKQAIQDMLKDGFVGSDRTIDPSLVANVGTIGDKKKGILGALGSLALTRLAKRGAKFLGKRAAKRVASKAATKSAAKTGAKVGAKQLAKTGGKMVAKSASKKIPLVGWIPALAYAGGRALKGDWEGAGLEVASGAAGSVPVIGTAGSLGIDGYLAKRDYDREMGESFRQYTSLYDRAKSIFESESGINESVDGYCFDDYVSESKIDNGILTSKNDIDESSVFYGYGTIVESFSSNEAELQRLFRRLSPSDGKVSLDDLMPKQTDSDDIKRAKARIRKLLEEEHSKTEGYDLNQKEAKKAWDAKRDASGELSSRELWHKGLDDTADSISHVIDSHIPLGYEISKKLNIPKALGHIAGAGVGGLLFGPVGAAAGMGLAHLLSKGHDRYKKEQYDKLHGNDDGNKSGVVKNVVSDAKDSVGGLVGAGIGSLLGGPVGGIIGTGLGHFGQKAIKKMAGVGKDNENSTDNNTDNGGQNA